MREIYDHIVIGAGLGGLSAACLLQQRQKKVLLLEAHTSVGGCASYFARKKFLFDVGATTLSGMKHEQPVQRLLRQLNIGLGLHLCDPGMTIHINGRRVQRWIDTDRWIGECERFFGAKNQRTFWKLVHSVSEEGWRSSYNMKNLPVQSLKDLLGLPAFLRYSSLVPYLFRSVSDILKETGLMENKDFVRFLTEQLMITAQSDIHDTPFLVGAMGLAYPADTWYVTGGMNSLPRTLQNNFISNGGTLMLRKKVLSVSTDGIHSVHTDGGLTFYGRNIISNATGWDNGDIFPSQERFFDKEYSSLAGWGAFTAYIGVEDIIDIGDVIYHQIILDAPLPYCAGSSIFLSFSHKNDHGRAPEGYRTLTVSTHIANPHQWWKLSKDEIEQRKTEITDSLLGVLNRHIPCFQKAQKPVIMQGTPITFEHFTNRKFGQVGGIPQSMHRPVFSWQGPRTKERGIYLVGDTIYPGQGAPGVILGALNLVERLE